MLFFRYFRIHKIQTTNLKYNPAMLNAEFHNESNFPSIKIPLAIDFDLLRRMPEPTGCHKKRKLIKIR